MKQTRNGNTGKDMIFNADEAAVYLSCARASLYRFARRGQVPSFKLGGLWRFSRRLLDEWMESQSRLS